jgi:hypothetical protein
MSRVSLHCVYKCQEASECMARLKHEEVSVVPDSPPIASAPRRGRASLEGVGVPVEGKQAKGSMKGPLAEPTKEDLAEEEEEMEEESAEDDGEESEEEEEEIEDDGEEEEKEGEEEGEKEEEE